MFSASFSLSGGPVSPATEVVEEPTPQQVVMAAESGESLILCPSVQTQLRQEPEAVALFNC